MSEGAKPRRVRRRAGGEGETPGPAAPPKTAVVVIHGMGEQWPMDTLRGFVEAAWSTDKDLNPDWSHGETYSKPERVTGSFELRRITTRYWTKQGAAQTRRVDFFEFYWAHLLQANSLGAVLGWLVRLLVRSPARVPRRLMPGWILGLLLLFAGVALTAGTALRPDLGRYDIPRWAWPVLALAGGAFSALWLRPVAGDAARYLSPTPGNVAARQAIREAGIDLVTRLQATGEYDRIIVAGHSLGSVIGHDVLNYAWGRLDPEALTAAHRQGTETLKRLQALEKAAGGLAGSGDAPPALDALATFRDAQRAYFQSLSTARNSDGSPLWLVSDFVTLGSPLSSADVLLAPDFKALIRKIAWREIPTSPPQSERADPVRFSYPPAAQVRRPHHAAVFAPTVWTNIYYPHVLGVFGDFVSGPVSPLLGAAVRDIKVPIGFPAFRHLSYWSKPERGKPVIGALRRALNLRLREEAAIWGDQAGANPVLAARLAGGDVAPVGNEGVTQ